jgi:hypothetical protein
MDFACIGLAFIADPPSIWAGAAITILSTKSKMHPSKASCFPKVKFGTIALLILHHIVESTTVGRDSISGWEADEPFGDRGVFSRLDVYCRSASGG